ncbi:MAG: hypothetical protein RDU25_00570 [Patescibacteria group bacterium]|nr:hypothetical protein [Patescibacteria group bacterium]
MIIRKITVFFTVLALSGAGCSQEVTAPKIAEPFSNPVSENTEISLSQGFGELPKIEYPKSSASITLEKELPKLPKVITVLRLQKGLPNDIEMRQITRALAVPAATLGDFSVVSEANLAWIDKDGYKWSYHGGDNTLEFWNDTNSKLLTVSDLRVYDELVNTATSFILAKGIKSSYYRKGIILPDWGMWWYTSAQLLNRCMTRETVNSIRAIGASVSLVVGQPPQLASAANSICVPPEFPARQVVRFRTLMDERDVVKNDGSYLYGAEIVVDSPENKVVSGKITLYSDPDRSDYPSIDNAKAIEMLKAGGLSGASGEITLDDFELVLYRLEDNSSTLTETYLIPALLAKGKRKGPDGSLQDFKIVVPLLAQ